ncbi:hypothetical protein [Spiroplasma endosymbiont of Dioctria linearis]|uniref:hypothetical protein n=1 Tax=Spiroplasma endosymbiont of Dioctria linearis TaxID=3066290 RepID=UPI00313D8E9A
MKKLIIMLSASAVSIASLAPIVNYAFYSPIETITKKISYNYDFAKLDWNNLQFKDVNGISQAELTSKDFTNSLKKCVEEMFLAIPEEISNVYSIKTITTSFNGSMDYKNSQAEEFSKEFVDANKDINAMKIENHTLVIERFNDPALGYLYYANVYASINNKQIRLFGLNSSNPYKNLDDLKKEFENTFELEIEKQIWIDGFDEQPWGIEIPQNNAFQYVKQIINWFMSTDEESKEMREKVIMHINIEKKVKLEKIDRPVTLYYANFNEKTKSYFPGDEYANNEEVIEEYFYMGITSNQNAFGEYKILIKNTPGKTVETI